jgi:hypothetical protein
MEGVSVSRETKSLFIVHCSLFIVHCSSCLQQSWCAFACRSCIYIVWRQPTDMLRVRKRRLCNRFNNNNVCLLTAAQGFIIFTCLMHMHYSSSHKNTHFFTCFALGFKCTFNACIAVWYRKKPLFHLILCCTQTWRKLQVCSSVMSEKEHASYLS